MYTKNERTHVDTLVFCHDLLFFYGTVYSGKIDQDLRYFFHGLDRYVFVAAVKIMTACAKVWARQSNIR